MFAMFSRGSMEVLIVSLHVMFIVLAIAIADRGKRKR